MTDKASNIIAHAATRRHLHLLEKVKGGQTLTTRELDELKKFESAADPAGDETSAAFEAGEIIKTQSEAARYLGVNTRTIRRYKERGMPVTAQGFYIKQMLDFYKAQENAPSGDKQRESKAQADLKELKAKLLEIELAIKEGRLLNRDEVEAANVRKILFMKRSLMRLGRATAPRLLKMRSAAKIKKYIDKEIRKIIEGFSTA